MLRVLIVDDNPIFMESINRIIESDDELTVIGLANNGLEAVQACKDNKPDIILMDIRMPVMDGIEATKLIKQYDRNIKVLVLTTFCEERLISRAMGNHCDGYILKEINDIDQFISTIKNTCKGLRVLNEEVYDKLIFKYEHSNVETVIEPVSSLQEFDLTDKEIEVISHITEGKKNSEIAEVIYTTEGVVKNIISKILEKLNLRNCKELAVWGAKHGL